MLNILINGNEGKMLTKQDIEKNIENAHEEIVTAKKDMLVLTDVISEKNTVIREMKIELEKAKVVKTGYERREVLKITYEDSKYDIWFDGTHQEILSGVAIIIKKLEDDGTTLEESLAFIKGAVKSYEEDLRKTDAE